MNENQLWEEFLISLGTKPKKGSTSKSTPKHNNTTRPKIMKSL